MKIENVSVDFQFAVSNLAASAGGVAIRRASLDSAHPGVENLWQFCDSFSCTCFFDSFC